MIVAGTALFIISLSWIDGIWDSFLRTSTDYSGHVRIVTTEYRAREGLRPVDENIENVDAMIEVLRSHEGVKGVFPLIESGVTLTVGEEIGDVFGLATGAPAAYFTEHMDADSKLIDGRWLEEGKGELVLGQKLVERTGAKLGDDVILLGRTQDGSMSPVKGKLVGIVKSGGPSIDRRIFMELSTMQWMIDIPGGATKVLVYGEDYQSVDGLAGALAADSFLASFDVRRWEKLAPWDSQLGMMRGIRYMLMFVVIFLSGLGVWNTMMMSVLERTTEIGVLRAMGLTRSGAVFLFVFEAAVIAVLGGAIGLIAGVLPALYMEGIGITIPQSLLAKVDLPFAETMHAELSQETVALAYVTAIGAALIGSLLPALRAASITPVTAMRRTQ